ncbi:hypothetical protein KY285_020293 [Solanum tuberosum]|nr:hypothetical protein KY285_020293 [Solanum tuberosum]
MANGTSRESFNKLFQLTFLAYLRLSFICSRDYQTCLYGALPPMENSHAHLYRMKSGKKEQRQRSIHVLGIKTSPLNAPSCFGGPLEVNYLLMRKSVVLVRNLQIVIAAIIRAWTLSSTLLILENLPSICGHFFADSLGIQTDHIPLRYFLMRWWSTEYKNEAHKLIMQSTPIFICWNLWKNRCAKKYGGKQSNIARVKFAIFKDTFRLLHTVFPYTQWPSSWRKLVLMIEGCTHETKVTLVQWNKPQNQWIKLNTDGSALSNPGRIGAGGILRNSTGELIMAYAIPLGEGTSNQAEIEAAIFGMSWCIHLKLNKVILEVDSQLLIDWIQRKSKPPWSISNQIHKLQSIINQIHNVICIHTLREGNFVADALSKHIHQITNPHVYFDTQQLPKEAASYYQLDKAEMVSIRRRKIKRIKEPP